MARPKKQQTQEQKKVDVRENASFSQLFHALETKYAGLDAAQMISAISRTSLYNAYTNNPFVQNNRVKSISSLPVEHSKDEIVDMLKRPGQNEIALRQTANALEWSAYPYFKLRKTYQDILTYRYYSYPCYLEEKDGKNKEFLREWRLVEKINQALQPERAAHEIAGQAVRDGKVFYTLRHSVDKSHNAVNYCFLQQLPQDWVKIVGFNNVSKYTVAFNLMYFNQPGTDWRQFGDILKPYMKDFFDIMGDSIGKDITDKKVVYASDKGTVNHAKLQEFAKSDRSYGTDVYMQNGKWFYWATLPVESVWTFEADDATPIVAPSMAGLILSMAQISQYENVQLEIVQNPLISVMTGEIPYQDNQYTAKEDSYKMSPTGRAFYEALWYQMCAANNTSGIGFFPAPLENMKLQQLSEAPSATDISGKGYSYAMMKSGSGILPISTEPRAGMVNVSSQIEAQFARGIYRNFERMMNWLYGKLNLNYEWKFKMFGDIFTEEAELESARKGLSLGILMDALKYAAICGHSLLDDLSISNAVIGIGIMDKRLPLVTSYTASNKDGKLPPSGNSPSVENPEGGRPTKDAGEMEAGADEGQESSIDAGD